METVIVPIQLDLPKGIPVSQFTSLAEVYANLGVDATAGESKVVTILNMYGRQKDALVAGRAFLSEQVVALGYPRKTTTVKVNGKDELQDDDTDLKHIARFVSDVAAGTVTAPTQATVNTTGPAGADGKPTVVANIVPINVTGASAADKAASLYAGLQAVIDAHGPFAINLKAAERTGGGINPPKYAITGAENMWTKGEDYIASVYKRFVDGFTTPAGLVVPAGAIEVEDFTDTAEDVKSRQRKLAFALAAYENWKAKQGQTDFV